MQTTSYPTAHERPRSVSAGRRSSVGGAREARRVQYAIWGIAVDDPETAELVTKVMHIATWMSLLALASAITALFSGWWFTLGIVPAVFVPCCGYVGAANRSRTALWFFILFNMFFAALFLALLISGIVETPAGAFGRGETAAFYISLVIGCGMAALQIAGAVFGLRLVRSKHLKGWEVATAEVPLGVPITAEAMPQPPYYAPPPGATAAPPPYPGYGQPNYGAWQGAPPAYGYPPQPAYTGAYPIGSPPPVTHTRTGSMPQPPTHWQYSTYQPPAGGSSGHTPIGSPPLAPQLAPVVHQPNAGRGRGESQLSQGTAGGKGTTAAGQSQGKSI